MISLNRINSEISIGTEIVCRKNNELFQMNILTLNNS